MGRSADQQSVRSFHDRRFHAEALPKTLTQFRRRHAGRKTKCRHETVQVPAAWRGGRQPELLAQQRVDVFYQGFITLPYSREAQVFLKIDGARDRQPRAVIARAFELKKTQPWRGTKF